MELHWTYDPDKRLATTTITDSLYYSTVDGGQTINKYENGVLVDTFHKYGKDNKFTQINWLGNHSNEREHTWEKELERLSELYPQVVGKLYSYWKDGFNNRNGDIVDIGIQRGMGVNNPIDKISVNRLCCPANETEWWDWDIVAITDADVAEDCMGRGTVWRKNKETKKLVRTSMGTPPYPCCVHPVIHGPYEVDDSDIDLHKGKRLT